MSLVKLVMLSLVAVVGLQVGAEQLRLNESVRVEVRGPVDVQLSYSDVGFAEFDPEQINVIEQDGVIRFVALEPTRLQLQHKALTSLHLDEGKLSILVTGNERLQSGLISAPDVCVSLMDRARFDSEQLIGKQLQISLAGQGKAVFADIVADLFELELADHSDLEVAGETREQDIDMRGYSHYDGRSLKSGKARAALEGYAAGLIQASDTASVKTSDFSSLSTRSIDQT